MKGCEKAARGAIAVVVALAALPLVGTHAYAVGGFPYIYVRVSVKVIHHPTTGERPLTAQGTPISNAEIVDMFRTANDSLLAATWRGYRFEVTDIIDVGHPCALPCPDTNPSAWYDETFPDPPPGQLSKLLYLENAAKTNAEYAWDPNAINVYVNHGGNGAVSSFPFDQPGSLDRSNDVIVAGAQLVDTNFRPAFAAATLHHEIGHYFNLRHTMNNQPACYDSTVFSCSLCAGADDDSVADTIQDRICAAPCIGCPPGWQRDDIARHNFAGLTYGQLNAAQKNDVDNVYENNMSYHNGGLAYGQYILYRVTEGQLDYWADTANNVRHAVTSGRTRFIERCDGCVGAGSPQIPYASVWQGNYYAQPGDILLIRPGFYPEQLTLDKAITLRATRNGAVTIGN